MASSPCIFVFSSEEEDNGSSIPIDQSSNENKSKKKSVAQELEFLPTHSKMKDDIPMIEEETEITDTLNPQWSCLRDMDHLYFCLSPLFQGSHYYRYGTYDSCQQHMSNFFHCLRSKTRLPGHEKSKQRIAEWYENMKIRRAIERSPNATHDVFDLTPEPPKIWLGKPNKPDM